MARQSAAEARYNRQELLPPTRDIVRLKDFCENELARLCGTFSQSPSVDTFSELASVALCRLIAFNNRRPEEPAKLQLEKYRNRVSWQQGNAEIAATLSEFEQKLLDRYVII